MCVCVRGVQGEGYVVPAYLPSVSTVPAAVQKPKDLCLAIHACVRDLLTSDVVWGLRKGLQLT